MERNLFNSYTRERIDFNRLRYGRRRFKLEGIKIIRYTILCEENRMKQKTLTPLSDHICFSLYTTSRAIQRLYNPSLEKHHLTYPQYLILVSLYDLGEVSIKKLGEELDLASNTLTPLLKRMEQHGLIKRERSKSDERSVLIRITKQGIKKREDAYDLPNILLNRSSLSVKEWEEMTRLLDKLYADTRVGNDMSEVN